jgi:hypothetical protein
MANGIPVRLSEALTLRARTVAAVQDRSLTEQVEHWARLGQVVEAAVSATTTQRLKARSYDEGLPAALAVADTAEGQRAAAELIRAENPIRYEETTPGTIVAVTRDGKRTKVTPRTSYRAPAPGDQLAARRGPKTAASARKGSAERAAVGGADNAVKLPRKRPKLVKRR